MGELNDKMDAMASEHKGLVSRMEERFAEEKVGSYVHLCTVSVCLEYVTYMCMYIHTYICTRNVGHLSVYLPYSHFCVPFPNFIFLSTPFFLSLNFPLLSSLCLSSPPHSSPSLPSLQHRLQKEANRQVAGLAQKAHDMAVKNLDQKTRSVYRENVQLAEALSLHLKDAEGMRKVG